MLGSIRRNDLQMVHFLMSQGFQLPDEKHYDMEHRSVEMSELIAAIQRDDKETIQAILASNFPKLKLPCKYHFFFF